MTATLVNFALANITAMDTLWVFNPENDIALGNNLRQFTPPRNAMLLRRYGALLPLWMADDGDIIYAADSSAADALFLSQQCRHLGRSVELLSRGNIGRVKRVRPWGWSKAIANELIRAGLPQHLMPSDERIERIRQLSHRRSSIIINSDLKAGGIDAVIPAEAASVAELEELLRRNEASVVKSPWSSSGRGVMYSAGISHDRLTQLCEGIIRHQGSVLVEPLLNKIQDFAMLFEMRSGKAEYAGLSVFGTGSSGNYSGNMVASERLLTKRITEHADIAELQRLKDALPEILAALIGDAYEGICGIDMMIYLGADCTTRIAPCIELNLRCTMGYVAHCLAERLLTGIPGADQCGFFSVSSKSHPAGNTPALAPGNMPALIKENTLPLIPENTQLLIPENPGFDIKLVLDRAPAANIPS